MQSLALKKEVDILDCRSLDYENIITFLNPAKANDLNTALKFTPAISRLDVALAFSRLDIRDLFTKAGLVQDWDRDRIYINNWIDKSMRLPLGAAFRLAKVLGVSAELLFEYWA